jgi:hypothetical protein
MQPIDVSAIWRLPRRHQKRHETVGKIGKARMVVTADPSFGSGIA